MPPTASPAAVLPSPPSPRALPRPDGVVPPPPSSSTTTTASTTVQRRTETKTPPSEGKAAAAAASQGISHPTVRVGTSTPRDVNKFSWLGVHFVLVLTAFVYLAARMGTRPGVSHKAILALEEQVKKLTFKKNELQTEVDKRRKQLDGYMEWATTQHVAGTSAVNKAILMAEKTRQLNATLAAHKALIARLAKEPNTRAIADAHAAELAKQETMQGDIAAHLDTMARAPADALAAHSELLTKADRHAAMEHILEEDAPEAVFAVHTLQRKDGSDLGACADQPSFAPRPTRAKPKPYKPRPYKPGSVASGAGTRGGGGGGGGAGDGPSHLYRACMRVRLRAVQLGLGISPDPLAGDEEGCPADPAGGVLAAAAAAAGTNTAGGTASQIADAMRERHACAEAALLHRLRDGRYSGATFVGDATSATQYWSATCLMLDLLDRHDAFATRRDASARFRVGALPKKTKAAAGAGAAAGGSGSGSGSPGWAWELTSCGKEDTSTGDEDSTETLTPSSCSDGSVYARGVARPADVQRGLPPRYAASIWRSKEPSENEDESEGEGGDPKPLMLRMLLLNRLSAPQHEARSPTGVTWGGPDCSTTYWQSRFPCSPDAPADAGLPSKVQLETAEEAVMDPPPAATSHASGRHVIVNFGGHYHLAHTKLTAGGDAAAAAAAAATTSGQEGQQGGEGLPGKDATNLADFSMLTEDVERFRRNAEQVILAGGGHHPAIVWRQSFQQHWQGGTFLPSALGHACTVDAPYQRRFIRWRRGIEEHLEVASLTGGVETAAAATMSTARDDPNPAQLSLPRYGVVEAYLLTHDTADHPEGNCGQFCELGHTVYAVARATLDMLAETAPDAAPKK